jgi:hypothetical protein
MVTSKLARMLAISLMLVTATAHADMMEECKVVDSNGNGLIRAYMADSGPNLEGDANAWIYVPYGQCAKINNGDFSGVSQAVRDKIQPSNINEAITTE